MIFYDGCADRNGNADPGKILEEIDVMLRASGDTFSPKVAEAMGAMASPGHFLDWWVGRFRDEAGIPEMSGAQSFIVYRSEVMYARLNLWFPMPENSATLSEVGRYLSVDQCHNHDFSFYTMCIFGSGYETTFYRCNAVSTLNSAGPGDKLELIKRGRHHLNAGRVLYVERDVDFHTQHWATDFSVTLNIIPANQKQGRQYIIDPDSGDIIFYLDNVKARESYDLIYGAVLSA